MKTDLKSIDFSEYTSKDLLAIVAQQWLSIPRPLSLDQANNVSYFVNTNEIISEMSTYNDLTYDEIEEELLEAHNWTFSIYSMIQTEMITMDIFFEYSPYDKSRFTLLAESFEEVE